MLKAHLGSVRLCQATFGGAIQSRRRHVVPADARGCRQELRDRGSTVERRGKQNEARVLAEPVQARPERALQTRGQRRRRRRPAARRGRRPPASLAQAPRVRADCRRPPPARGRARSGDSPGATRSSSFSELGADKRPSWSLGNPASSSAVENPSRMPAMNTTGSLSSRRAMKVNTSRLERSSHCASSAINSSGLESAASERSR